MSNKNIHVGYCGDFKRIFGSNLSCDHILPQWPDKAAGLKRIRDRLFVKDYDCSPGLDINGKKIHKGEWVEITRYDQITICGTQISLKPVIFLGKDLVDLSSSPLNLILKNKKVLCDKVYIKAKSGTFTAILGPAGSGKTSFLNMLNGHQAPTKGNIFINKKIDLNIEYNNIRDAIGYVPQDDLMIPELTLRQSLDYRLRLKYPDMKINIRKRLIEGTCQNLGFKGDRLNTFLDTAIGSPESGIRGLSGGEKKRANIAHELILNPSVLILDEPTSGLSSVDSEHIIRLLKRLAVQNSLTVIATIHQPSKSAFKEFDDLLLISLGGRVAFYGPAKYSVQFFEKTTGIQCANDKNPPEFLLSFLSDEQNCKNSVSRFEKAIQLLKQGNRGFNYLYDIDKNLSNQPGKPVNIKQNVFKLNPLLAILNVYNQWYILSRRNINVLLKDKTNVLLLLGQVPIIACLILIAFSGYANDHKKLNNFAQRIYFFGQLKEPFESQNKSVPVDNLLRQAEKKAKAEDFLISEIESRNRGAIYFILVASSIWFGILGGCKEVVTEKHILAREFRSNVFIVPYFFSKLTVWGLFVGLQTMLLTTIVAPILLELSFFPILLLWVILWICSVTSVSLGLCVSCFSPNFRFALTIVPLLLVPQLVLGGLIRPLTNLEDQKWPHYLGAATIQRWAFEASLNVDKYNDGGVLKQFSNFENSHPKGRYAELNIVQYKNSSILSSFFSVKREFPLITPLLNQILFIAFCFILGYWQLRRQFLK